MGTWLPLGLWVDYKIVLSPILLARHSLARTGRVEQPPADARYCGWTIRWGPLVILLAWRRQHFGVVSPGYLPEPLDIRRTFGGRW